MGKGITSETRFWLFVIMYDDLPKTWGLMLRQGVAAQHYPPGWTNATQNRNALKRLHTGDWIVAAFKKHRVGGYGRLTTCFQDTGPSLRARNPYDGATLSFRQRFGCDWTVIPPDRDPPYIICADLKNQVQTSLVRGSCVREISKRSFLALKSSLRKAGAVRNPGVSKMEAVVQSDLDSRLMEEGLWEGKKGRRSMVYYERSPRLRKAAIRRHGTACMVCGLDFGKLYGPHGEGFIEVHHVRPVSSAGVTRPDPAQDMAVVCSNCHRMIHRKMDQVLSLQELKRIVTKAKKGNRTTGGHS